MMRRLLIAWSVVMLSAPALAAELKAGDRAPAFKTALLAAPTNEFDSSALRGKVAYVDFWASWCGPCKQAMPVLDTLYKKFGNDGFVVVGVNKDAKPADAERFMKSVAVSFPLVADAGNVIAQAFNPRHMPTGYLIDRKGHVRHVHSGFRSETAAELEAQVASLIKETP